MPNDSFDFDGTAEPIIADIQIDGKPRKVLFQANKNGFLYVLDRTNGQLLAAHPFMNQNWAKNIDLKTGRPVLTDLLDRAMKGETNRARATWRNERDAVGIQRQDRSDVHQLLGIDARVEVR
jgi:glucose dehydrogenase